MTAHSLVVCIAAAFAAAGSSCTDEPVREATKTTSSPTTIRSTLTSPTAVTIKTTSPPTTYIGQRPPFTIPAPTTPGGLTIVDLHQDDLHFENGSAAIGSDDQDRLTALAGRIVKLRPQRVEILGCTDHSGGPDYPNDELSKLRAAVVADALARSGVSVDEVDGLGPECPLEPGQPDSYNRRVRITITPRERR